MTAPTPSATRHMATLAPMTSPKATAGAWRRLAATPVASSSGSAPASNRARAKVLTRRATAAGARCSAKASAPQMMAPTPASTAVNHATPATWPSLSRWQHVPVIVRPRIDADLDRCVELVNVVHALDDYPPRWWDEGRDFITSASQTAAWVAEEGDQVVGHVALHA